VEPKYSYKIGDDICDFQKNGKSALAKLLGIEKIQKTNNFRKIEIEYDRFADYLGCREIKFLISSQAVDISFIQMKFIMHYA
jgi:predicted nucleic acid-binding Zn finger protein